MEVYVDGSYGNGWLQNSVGVGIYFGKDSKFNCSITVVGNKTYIMDNQGAEAIAIYIALLLTKSAPKVFIYSDNQHSITSLTTRYNEFKKNGWMTTKNKPVAHSNILKECGNLIDEKRLNKRKINIKQVVAHSGIIGNEMADRFAYNAMSTGMQGNCFNSFTINLPKNIYNLVAHDIVFRELYTKMNNAYNPDPYQVEFTQVDIPSSSTIDEVVNHMDMDNQQPELSSPSEILVEPTDTEFNYLNKEFITTDEIKEDNYLSIICIECSEGILIRYPFNGYKKINEELDINAPSVLAFTTCRKCLAVSSKHLAFNTLVNERKISFNESHISPILFMKSLMHRCAEVISGSETIILTTDNSIKYISILDIQNICNRKCKVSSIDTDNSTALPYLQFGFL